MLVQKEKAKMTVTLNVVRSTDEDNKITTKKFAVSCWD